MLKTASTRGGVVEGISPFGDMPQCGSQSTAGVCDLKNQFRYAQAGAPAVASRSRRAEPLNARSILDALETKGVMTTAGSPTNVAYWHRTALSGGTLHGPLPSADPTARGDCRDRDS